MIIAFNKFLFQNTIIFVIIFSLLGKIKMMEVEDGEEDWKNIDTTKDESRR